MGNSIFSSSDDAKTKTEFRDKVDIHSKSILNVVQRQKDLESTLDIVNDKLELIDHNTVKSNKESFKEIKSIRSDLKDLKLEIKTLKEVNSKIIKQIKLMSSSDEVKKLEKYIDLWNPMGFVSRDEFNKLKEKTEIKNENNTISKEKKIDTTNLMTKTEFENYSKKLKLELKEIIGNFLNE